MFFSSGLPINVTENFVMIIFSWYRVWKVVDNLKNRRVQSDRLTNVALGLATLFNFKIVVSFSTAVKKN